MTGTKTIWSGVSVSHLLDWSWLALVEVVVVDAFESGESGAPPSEECEVPLSPLLAAHEVGALVKFPWIPIALRTTEALPVLLTSTEIVVVFPDTEKAERLAVRLPWALCSWLSSSEVRCCWSPVCPWLWSLPVAGLTTPTAEGHIWYPVVGFTMNGFSCKRATLFPSRSAGLARLTVRVLPPVAKVTGEVVPLTSMLMPVTVKAKDLMRDPLGRSVAATVCDTFNAPSSRRSTVADPPGGETDTVVIPPCEAGSETRRVTDE